MFVGALKYQCRPCECSRGHESASRGRKGANKGHERAIEVVGVPKEAVRVQHSHGIYNTLTAVRKF